MSDNGDALRGTFDVVEAQSFVLLAPDGTKRAVLGMADDKVFLALLDGDEQHRIALVLTDDVPSVQLLDKNGLVRVAVALDSEGTPGITLNDEFGNAGLIMAILPNGGGPGILISDENGTQRVFLTLIEGTHMEFLDETGKCIFSAPAKGPARKRR